MRSLTDGVCIKLLTRRHNKWPITIMRLCHATAQPPSATWSASSRISGSRATSAAAHYWLDRLIAERGAGAKLPDWLAEMAMQP
jgi:hypothetical protein